MKVSVLLEPLQKNLSFTSHAVSTKSQLPILLSFLVSASNGILEINATDLEIGIQIKIAAKIDKEGEVCVNAKTFLELINSIKDEKIEIESGETEIRIKGTKIKASIPVMPAVDFPKLYQSLGNKKGTFKREDIEKKLGKIIFAAALDSARPAYSGVLLTSSEKGIIMVATDGHRLSLNSNLAIYTEEIEKDLIIPARVLKELSFFKDEESDVDLYLSEESNQLAFVCGEKIIVGRLIESEYPNYEKVIPAEHTTRVVVDREETQRAVKTSAIFARDASNVVKMAIVKSGIIFSAAGSSGQNETEVQGEMEGEENEIAFSSRFLLEFLSNVQEEQIVFEMTGPLNPGVFRVGEDNSYLHIIMPIRTQN